MRATVAELEACLELLCSLWVPGNAEEAVLIAMLGDHRPGHLPWHALAAHAFDVSFAAALARYERQDPGMFRQLLMWHPASRMERNTTSIGTSCSTSAPFYVAAQSREDLWRPVAALAKQEKSKK